MSDQLIQMKRHIVPPTNTTDINIAFRWQRRATLNKFSPHAILIPSHSLSPPTVRIQARDNWIRVNGLDSQVGGRSIHINLSEYSSHHITS